jgi:glucose/arabinose dehydrogenase/PKD repeat protein
MIETMRLLKTFCLLLLLVSCTPSTPEPEPEPEPKPSTGQFEDILVASVPLPTAFAFTPDGTLFITTKNGQVFAYANGLLETPALDLASKICDDGERGILGIAIDPEFQTNGFVYLYYTFKKFDTCEARTERSPVNRVSRFILDDTTIDPQSEVVLIDNVPSYANNHNAGDVHFGKDGFLYISIGDSGCDPTGATGCAEGNAIARSNNVLLGKILRITRDGNIPADNPFLGSSTARCNITGSTTPDKTCQEIYATGLRNPFRMAFDSNAEETRFFINDVGQGVWEEINLGQAGADYGWNLREGNCANGSDTNCAPPPPNIINPVFAYRHGDWDYTDGTTSEKPFQNCNSITGGAFVPNGVWPSAFDNTYLFADFVCGRIFSLKDDKASLFRTAEGPIHLGFGPFEQTQALYYASFAEGGQMRRVAYVGANNRAPEARATATPSFGVLPLETTLDASASSDPDGDALTYTWQLGDGQQTSGKIVKHTYTKAGKYDVVLTVTDDKGASSSQTLRVDAGNTPPTITLLSPNLESRFAVGERITLNATATDAEEGELSGESLSWQAWLRHDDHVHPYVAPTSGSVLELPMPAPENLAATKTSYLLVYLTATDVTGLSTRQEYKLEPRLVEVTFNTEPQGLKLEVNNNVFTTPVTLTSWQGYELRVTAPNQNGATFASWNDGAPATRIITTPAEGSSYTARFTVQ